jgi:TPR repeat protein
LSEGKSPKKGLLIDFLGNFVRSAKEGLPIYRIENGPGFVWRASFDLNGRGSFRFAAIDASEFSSLSPALVTAQLPSGSGGDAPVTECDTYAASAVDPYRKTAGVPEEKLDASLAIPACASAIRKFPNSPRLKYQLGRGYWKSNNFGEAIIWFRQAAEYRYAPAEALLGYMFQFGQGVPQNYREAFSWYSQAANQGFAPAQKNLGLFYEMGLGLTKDILQASEWYRKAAEQGNVDAQNHLKRLSALITKENAEENARTETVRRETEGSAVAEGL